MKKSSRERKASSPVLPASKEKKATTPIPVPVSAKTTRRFKSKTPVPQKPMNDPPLKKMPKMEKKEDDTMVEFPAHKIKRKSTNDVDTLVSNIPLRESLKASSVTTFDSRSKTKTRHNSEISVKSPSVTKTLTQEKKRRKTKTIIRRKKSVNAQTFLNTNHSNDSSDEQEINQNQSDRRTIPENEEMAKLRKPIPGFIEFQIPIIDTQESSYFDQETLARYSFSSIVERLHKSFQV